MWCNKGFLRRSAVLCAAFLGLAGCGSSGITDRIGRIVPDPSEYIFASIVADDQRAVAAAQEAITKGGTAADAAVALYFTLSVTMPSVASLGGGGVCLVHDPRKDRTEMLDFVARVPPSGLANGDRPSAVPGNVRGMALLHSRYGRLPWRDLLTRAESLARGGMIMSSGGAQELARAAGPLFADENARRVFALQGGQPVSAGTSLRQIDLAVTLGHIRARGAGAFYTGNLADRVVDGVERAGGSLTKSDLRDMVPQWRDALWVPFENGRMYVAGPPALGGIATAQMWRMLVTDARYQDATAEERMHLLAEVTRRAFDDRRKLLIANGGVSSVADQLLSAEHARSLMSNYDPGAATPVTTFQSRPEDTHENPSGTGFIVVDGTGLAVACNVTLYNPFGTGRLVPGIGIFVAQAPGLGTRNPYSLDPVIVTGPKGERFRFAAAGAGGGAVPPAIVNVAAKTLLEGMPLGEAMTGGRVYANPTTAHVVVESSESPVRVDTLARRGHDVRRLDALARLNVIFCKTGVPMNSLRDVDCDAKADADAGGEGLGSTFLLELN